MNSTILQLQNGEVVTLSEVNKKIKEIYDPEIPIKNRDIKKFIIKNHGEEISFIEP